MPLKIAVLGSAPSSNRLAPFHDKSWQIWACSPANIMSKALPRIDVWFEMHAWSFEQKAKENPAYYNFVKRFPRVYMQGHDPEIPGSIRYPLDEIKQLDPWGAEYFLTSSPALMLALACVAQLSVPKEERGVIGMWGVDMAAQGEYSWQRPGCHYWMRHVQEITGHPLLTPTECDIHMPPPLYGFCESTFMWRRMNARMREIDRRIQVCVANEKKARETRLQLMGAMENIVYDMRTWIPHQVDDERHVEPAAAPAPAEPDFAVVTAKAERKAKRQAKAAALQQKGPKKKLSVRAGSRSNGAANTNQAQTKGDEEAGELPTVS